MSHRDAVEFEKLIDQLKKDGVIVPSRSLWLHPVVLVRKRDRSLRVCVDFRRLNALVPLDGFALPRINDLIALLGRARVFSVAGLKDGFFQVPIREEDRPKTAFFTGRRLMQFRRMPQGFKKSPAIFQRVMTVVLAGLIGVACLVYVDDILIFGKDEEEHDRNFDQVLQRLSQYQLKENETKRVYRVRQVKFLGFMIGNGTFGQQWSGHRAFVTLLGQVLGGSCSAS